ncbi:toprim domain-containing protein [Capnocytophaga sp. oral taxon 864]|uniref:toprim domain-containing protein n=1 Tax=Capnocytophaga sp. oral taxon 864 TaxID=1316593 RepID=UPI000D0370C5|nr:toprim domain-containing protein [Capnocytophaga sp. oral taxon 864]AVM54675.1 DNA primase [Capnocytophaga sp. oral taxon 864]
MNCKQANTQISIRNVLESFSLFPSKDNSKTAFYFAFDREEKTPSLFVNFVKNIAFDFGTGKKYDIVSLVQGIKQCSVSQALEYLSQFNFSFKEQMYNITRDGSKYEILSISEVKHYALIQYLKERRIENNIHLLKEIHYKISNKKYFGIGFKNDANGYEVRNKYSKICIGRKDITTIKNKSNNLRIFEGFMDYLSFKQMEKALKKALSDYVILNSVTMIFKLEKIIKSYEKIELYFDNDEAGNRATNEVKRLNPYVKDNRILYQNYKDLNDFIMGKISLLRY